MKEKLIADAKFKHDGQIIHSGQEFDAESIEADDLVAIGFAHRPKGMIASAVNTVTRAYRRRDMKAEN